MSCGENSHWVRGVPVDVRQSPQGTSTSSPDRRLGHGLRGVPPRQRAGQPQQEPRRDQPQVQRHRRHPVPFHPCAVLAILASGGGDDNGPIHSTYFPSSFPCSTTTSFSSFSSCSSGPKFASSAILLPRAMRRGGASFLCGRGGRKGKPLARAATAFPLLLNLCLLTLLLPCEKVVTALLLLLFLLFREITFFSLLLLLRYAAGRVERRRRHGGRYFSSPSPFPKGTDCKSSFRWGGGMEADENNNRKGNRKEGERGTVPMRPGTKSFLFLLSLSLSLSLSRHFLSSPRLDSNCSFFPLPYHTGEEGRGLLSLSGSPAAVRRRGGGRRALIGEREEEGASQRERKKEVGKGERGWNALRSEGRGRGEMLLTRCVTYGGRYTPPPSVANISRSKKTR